MCDADDSLKIVIVCDMWLTGTDIPCLHTLYIDKPMRGHTIIQAISRVNRVFKNKPHGLIVDYIGIGDELREATATYTKGGGRGDPAPSVAETAKPLFLLCMAEVLAALPPEKPYAAWRKLSKIEHDDLCAFVWGVLMDDEAQREAFLQAELRMTKAWLLVKSMGDMRSHADFIIFCQNIRNGLRKPTTSRTRQSLDDAISDLIDDSIDTEGVVDIFQSAGLSKADISILDDDFLQTFKDKPHEDLRLKLLESLLHDEIRTKAARNIAQATSMQELLERTLRNYHNRIIDAAAVIQEMIRIRQQMSGTAQRAGKLNITEEELAFYDAVSVGHDEVYEQPELCAIIREVVKALKANLRVDWADPAREQLQAEIRAIVRRTLRQRGIKPEALDVMTERVIVQATALYRAWPIAA